MKPEEIECIAFSQWLEFQKLKFTHIPNENVFSFMNRNMAVRLGAKQKRCGVRKGLPDYIILTPRGSLFVEMKEPKKKPKKGNPLENWKEGQLSKGGISREQKDWIDAINATPGAQAAVCYSAEEAIVFVQRILKD